MVLPVDERDPHLFPTEFPRHSEPAKAATDDDHAWKIAMMNLHGGSDYFAKISFSTSASR